MMNGKSAITILIVAAAAVMGWLLWRSRQQQVVVVGSVPTPTVAPSQVSPQAVIANAFGNLLNFGSNWLAQWANTKLNAPTPNPATTTPYKPPTLTSKGPSTTVPAGSTPNLVTTPTYFA